MEYVIIHLTKDKKYVIRKFTDFEGLRQYVWSENLDENEYSVLVGNNIQIFR
jgi:hypothetical protein